MHVDNRGPGEEVLGNGTYDMVTFCRNSTSDNAVT